MQKLLSKLKKKAENRIFDLTMEIADLEKGITDEMPLSEFNDIQNQIEEATVEIERHQELVDHLEEFE